MHFGFALDSRNIDLWDIDFLDADVFKASWKTKNCYAEDVLKTSSRHVLKTSSRRLQDQQMFAGFIFNHFCSFFKAFPKGE